MFGCAGAVVAVNPYSLLVDNYETLDAGIPGYSYDDISINDHHSGIYCEAAPAAPWNK